MPGWPMRGSGHCPPNRAPGGRPSAMRARAKRARHCRALERPNSIEGRDASSGANGSAPAALPYQ
ncbi:hypothetical protein [Lysobacter gummosus]|uniref:hypothetical protein n=1 Tax=Lysobacter gummosus TaxID=262324 RepID=UPI0036375C9F